MKVRRNLINLKIHTQEIKFSNNITFLLKIKLQDFFFKSLQIDENYQCLTLINFQNSIFVLKFIMLKSQEVSVFLYLYLNFNQIYKNNQN